MAPLEPILRRELHPYVVPVTSVFVLSNAVQQFDAQQDSLGGVVPQVEHNVLTGVVIGAGFGGRVVDRDDAVARRAGPLGVPPVLIRSKIE